MAVNLLAPADLLPVAGVSLGVASAAIKKAGRDDLLVMCFAPGTVAGGVFTQNAFAAAPVHLCRTRLASGAGRLRALLINSGNANAATGDGGAEDAATLTHALAAQLGCEAAQVWPFSTGVIGVRLPVARMRDALPRALAAADPGHWAAAATAIMTTDTVPKGLSRRVETTRGPVTVTGIAKGVGMIYPNMATLLAVVATDAPMDADAVQALTREAADRSFNCVTVDSDTSTNDSFVIAATGAIGGAPFAEGSADALAVREAIFEVCETLAQAIARDGEGATRFVTRWRCRSPTRPWSRPRCLPVTPTGGGWSWPLARPASRALIRPASICGLMTLPCWPVDSRIPTTPRRRAPPCWPRRPTPSPCRWGAATRRFAAGPAISATTT